MSARRTILRSLLTASLAVGTTLTMLPEPATAGAASQPDLTIGTLGVDVYDATGASEIKKVEIRAGHTSDVTVTMVNDGLYVDSFTFTGGPNDAPFTVKYLTGISDVTTDVQQSQYSIGPIQRMGTSTLTMRIKAGNKATPKTKGRFKLSVASMSDSSLADAIIVVARGK